MLDKGCPRKKRTERVARRKAYSNYAAALRIWVDNDKKGALKKGIPDYSYKEGESL